MHEIDHFCDVPEAVDPGLSNPLKQGHGPLADIGADANDRV
jgi:hypothetical protein